MSYSRWSNSRWYTYWSVSSDETQDGQVFQISLVGWFTYKDLKEDIEGCLDKAIANECGPDSTHKVTSIERQELKEYMTQFVTDVERQFNAKARENSQEA